MPRQNSSLFLVPGRALRFNLQSTMLFFSYIPTSAFYLWCIAVFTLRSLTQIRFNTHLFYLKDCRLDRSSFSYVSSILLLEYKIIRNKSILKSKTTLFSNIVQNENTKVFRSFKIWIFFRASMSIYFY